MVDSGLQGDFGCSEGDFGLHVTIPFSRSGTYL